MQHAILVDGNPAILARTTFTVGDTKYSPGTLDGMSREEKLGIGVWEVIRAPDVDNSTGSQTVTEGPVVAVLADHITHTFTKRDMTAAEMEAVLDSRVDALMADDVTRGLKQAYEALLRLANIERNRHSLSDITPGQFRDAVEDLEAFSLEAFRDWLRSLL